LELFKISLSIQEY